MRTEPLRKRDSQSYVLLKRIVQMRIPLVRNIYRPTQGDLKAPNMILKYQKSVMAPKHHRPTTENDTQLQA